MQLLKLAIRWASQCLILPRKIWHQSTDSGGMEGWVGLDEGGGANEEETNIFLGMSKHPLFEEDFIKNSPLNLNNSYTF